MRNLGRLFVGVLLIGGLGDLGGCGSKFAGEWVQDGTIGKDGSFTPASDERRAALKFEPPARVRYGFYQPRSDAVDPESVQSTDYSTTNHRSVAQFGVFTAHPDGADYLLVTGPVEGTVRMVRVRGKTVFPPVVQLPQLSRGTAAGPEDALAAGYSPDNEAPPIAP
jgi:hypothetical protein